MNIIQWHSSYESGISIIDTKHKEIVEWASKLDSAMMGGKGYEILEQLFSELILSMEKHFEEEEKLMSHYKYPDLKIHKEEHEKIKKELYSIFRLFNQRKLPFAPMKVKDFLKNWIDNHILKADTYYVDFFEENNIIPDEFLVLNVFEDKKIEDIDFY